MSRRYLSSMPCVGGDAPLNDEMDSGHFHIERVVSLFMKGNDQNNAIRHPLGLKEFSQRLVSASIILIRQN